MDDYLSLPPVVDEVVPARMPDRTLRVFVSSAEPSGERHAARLVGALRSVCLERGAPPPALVGLGGDLLRAEGVETFGDPVARAAMGADVLRSLGFYLGLVERAARAFREERIDLFVPVDSPALHQPLGRIARRFAVPTVHYVAPQLWGWAPWRVAAYRRAVDRALTILPFEPAWFRARGVAIGHVGHPQLDLLADESPPRAGEPKLLVLLPGSRESVVRRNLPWMLLAAARVRLEAPEIEVRIGCASEEIRAVIEGLRARVHADWAPVADGPLHPLLSRARVALSVSGTVLIDLLVRRVPAVVIYRLGNALSSWTASRALGVRWFSSVNLLAGREVYPEFSFHGEGPLEEVSAQLLACYKDEGRRAAIQEGLDVARRALGPKGAARRAAEHALDVWAAGTG